MCQGTEMLIRALESGKEEEIQQIRGDWMSFCGRSVQYYHTVFQNFQLEKMNQIWDNRMIENRLAVAQQLAEVSRIMEHMADDLYDIRNLRRSFGKYSGSVM